MADDSLTRRRVRWQGGPANGYRLRPKHSFIYAMCCAATGHVKFGFSHNPTDRRKTLQRQRGNPVELLAMIPGTHSDEWHLHGLHAGDRVQGEWFSPTPNVLGSVWEMAAAEQRLHEAGGL